MCSIQIDVRVIQRLRRCKASYIVKNLNFLSSAIQNVLKELLETNIITRIKLKINEEEKLFKPNELSNIVDTTKIWKRRTVFNLNMEPRAYKVVNIAFHGQAIPNTRGEPKRSWISF